MLILHENDQYQEMSYIILNLYEFNTMTAKYIIFSMYAKYQSTKSEINTKQIYYTIYE